MAYKSHYTTKLEPGCHYHIYNRCVGKELLFKTTEHNRFFLSKVEKYVCPVADLLAYSLNRNHFHLTIQTHLNSNERGTSQAFRKLFQSYAMAFNTEQGRYGTLFQEPYKRGLVDSPEYLRNLIRYQHYNPEHHHLVRDFRAWPHTSYHQLTGQDATILARLKVLDLFGGLDGFLQFHSSRPRATPDQQSFEDG